MKRFRPRKRKGRWDRLKGKDGKKKKKEKTAVSC